MWVEQDVGKYIVAQMGLAAVDSGALRPSSNTVHQRATDRVTFTGALTSALWLVGRLSAT